MLEVIYSAREDERIEPDSVTDFLFQYVKRGDDEMESKFLEAVRDTRLEGFREGMKAALELIACLL